MKWYRKAADQGYANAQGNVGLLYENGLGVPKNPIEAQKWFRMAVANGLEPAKQFIKLMMAK